MKPEEKKRVAAIKASLLEQLEEWIGFHLPPRGDEDREKYEERRAAIEAMETFDDVYIYAERFLVRSEEFLERWDL